jgi:hypothetical protein
MLTARQGGKGLELADACCGGSSLPPADAERAWWLLEPTGLNMVVAPFWLTYPRWGEMRADRAEMHTSGGAQSLRAIDERALLPEGLAIQHIPNETPWHG